MRTTIPGPAQVGIPAWCVNHKQKVYVERTVHTNTIEGSWSPMKRGISGVYPGVSTKHLQSYFDEYVCRYNNRDVEGRRMFTAMVDRIEKAPSLSQLPSPTVDQTANA